MIKRENLKTLPKTPGVYLYKNSKQKVIYVGKAINLRNRVKSYFVGRNKRNDDLIENIADIQTVIVKTELEALLLEARYIKQYHPKYNIIQKDNKRYLYVGITKDEYPRVIQTRLPENENNLADWFGPFTSSFGLKEIMRMVRKIFPYCSDLKCSPKTPCFYYRLNLCPGVGIVTLAEYKQNIQKIKKFLNGDISLLIKDLDKSMKTASKNLRYEEAQTYKKQIEMIQYFLGRYNRHDDDEKQEEQLAGLRELVVRYQGYDPYIIHRIECFDISNLGKNIIVGSMVVFTNGEPDNAQYRQFKVKNYVGDTEAIKEVIQRRLRHQEWLYPQIIVVDGGKGQISSAVGAFKELDLIGKIGLIGIEKEFETLVIPKLTESGIKSWKKINFARSNTTLQMIQHLRDESHRFAQRYYKKLHTKRLLQLL